MMAAMTDEMTDAVSATAGNLMAIVPSGGVQRGSATEGSEETGLVLHAVLSNVLFMVIVL